MDNKLNLYQNEGPAHYKIIDPGTYLGIDLANTIKSLDTSIDMNVLDIKPMPNGRLLIIYAEYVEFDDDDFGTFDPDDPNYDHDF